MKKWMPILIALCFVLLPFPSQAGIRVVGGGLMNASSATTDYSADPNCMFAARMNGGLSANGDGETDRSGEGGDLTEDSGDIPNSATVASGYSGTSRDFEYGDSENLQHADGNSTDINGADQKMSVVAWVTSEDVLEGGIYTIASKHDRGTGHLQYNLFLNGTDGGKYQIKFQIGAGPNTTISTTTDYAEGTAQFIAAVYNDTDVRIYVDGVLACTPDAYTDGLQDDSGSKFGVGCSFNNDSDCRQFDGLIDEVGVFDRDLSAAEVLDIKNNGLFGDKGAGD